MFITHRSIKSTDNDLENSSHHPTLSEHSSPSSFSPSSPFPPSSSSSSSSSSPVPCPGSSSGSYYSRIRTRLRLALGMGYGNSRSSHRPKRSRRGLVSLLVCTAGAALLIYVVRGLSTEPTEVGFGLSRLGGRVGSKNIRYGSPSKSKYSKSHSPDSFPSSDDDLTHESALIRSANSYSPGSPLPFTQFLTHAPGFSVIQNAYFDSRTLKWFFISPRGLTWVFPDVRFVLTEGNGEWDDWDSDANDKKVKEKTKSLVGEVLDGREEARKRFGFGDEVAGAGIAEDKDSIIEIVPGTTFFFNDNIYLDHYYHVVGEMFLGMWRAWKHYLMIAGGDGEDDRLGQDAHVDRLIFAHVDEETLWDHAGMNKFTLGTWFADSSFEFSKDWNRRIASNKIYLFEKIVISDRISGHRGPKCKGKPFDEVFELSVPTDWVTDLREAILAGYSGDVKPAASANGKGAGKGKKMGKGKGEEKPVITYMSRQTAKTRTLTPESHEALIKELQKIEDEGLAEFNVEEFTDLDPKDEQVAKIARTTFMVGMHGNGLTHVIWMDPSPKTGIIEIQTKNMNMDDYTSLSAALGIPHWIAQIDSLCTRDTCGERGAGPEVDLGAKDFTVDAKIVAAKIRETISQGNSE